MQKVIIWSVGRTTGIQYTEHMNKRRSKNMVSCSSTGNQTSAGNTNWWLCANLPNMYGANRFAAVAFYKCICDRQTYVVSTLLLVKVASVDAVVAIQIHDTVADLPMRCMPCNMASQVHPACTQAQHSSAQTYFPTSFSPSRICAFKPSGFTSIK